MRSLLLALLACASAQISVTSKSAGRKLKSHKAPGGYATGGVDMPPAATQSTAPKKKKDRKSMASVFFSRARPLDPAAHSVSLFPDTDPRTVTWGPVMLERVEHLASKGSTIILVAEEAKHAWALCNWRDRKGVGQTQTVRVVLTTVATFYFRPA